MDDTRIPDRKTAHPRAFFDFFTLEILACIVGALILTVMGFGIAKALVRFFI